MALDAAEEARAALWRQQQRNRATYTAGRVRAIAGDPVAYAALLARWAPILTLGTNEEAAGGDVDSHT